MFVAWLPVWSQPTKPEWRLVYDSDEVQFLLTRKKGLRNLLIYAGPHTIHLNDIAEAVIGSGYNILAPRFPHDPGLTREETIQLLMNELAPFIDHRSGYRTRILLIPGSWFSHRVVERLQTSQKDNPGQLSGLVILRPGDLPAARKTLRTLRKAQLPGRILWLGSTEYRDRRIIRGLRVFRPESDIFATTRALNGFKTMARNPIRKEAAAKGALQDFLLLLRTRPEWQPATSVFSSGCVATRGNQRIRRNIAAYSSSSKRDNDICPLFLRTGSGRLLHMHSFTAGGCVFLISQARKLICSY